MANITQENKQEQQVSRAAANQSDNSRAVAASVSGQAVAQLESESEEEESMQLKSKGDVAQLESESEEEESMQLKSKGDVTQLESESEEEESMQLKSKSDVAQMESESEEEESVQMKPIVQRKATSSFSSVIQKKGEENKTGMPDNLKSGVENLSGMDMSDVRVHQNSDKPGKLNAHAYAQGTDIHVAPGQEKHLPHEAWHVVQQKQGRVKPTMQMKGVAVNDNSSLETEADNMGDKAMRG